MTLSGVVVLYKATDKVGGSLLYEKENKYRRALMRKRIVFIAFFIQIILASFVFAQTSQITTNFLPKF